MAFVAELKELREAVCYVCQTEAQLAAVLALMEPGHSMSITRGGDKESRPDRWYVAAYHPAGAPLPAHLLCDREDVA